MSGVGSTEPPGRRRLDVAGPESGSTGFAGAGAGACGAGAGFAGAGAGTSLRAVLFDIDFTLAKPGPDLGPEGYERIGARHGLVLDPSRYDEAREAALEHLERHPELDHDEEIWFAFTERIVRGMSVGSTERPKSGGAGFAGGGTSGEGDVAREVALEITRGWERAGNFDLYEDALPVLEELRRHGLKLGLVTNSARNVVDFVAHHRLDVDAAITSFEHGKTKPHETIFRAALELLGVEPGEAVMIGDSLSDDVEGARAMGMRAFLVDREDRFPEVPDRLPTLLALPAALGLQPEPPDRRL
jgi:HAD superfamily hydrolase (TIGR01549 family)